MAHNTGNKEKKLLTIIAVIVAVLALALPVQASEHNHPPLNLRPTPTIEINPDEHHHDHSNLDGPAPLSALELAASTCSGGFAGEYPCQGRISMPGHRFHEQGRAEFIYR